MSICKYCNSTEITFDNAHKSKSGKLIPLEKASGLPHNCSENPFTKQQQQTQVQKTQSQVQLQPQVQPQPQTIVTLETINQKLDHLIRLVYAHLQEQQPVTRDKIEK